MARRRSRWALPSRRRHSAAPCWRSSAPGPSTSRSPVLAYVPAAQGYAVVTVCRALYALETGEQTTKEEAAAWAAERFPERADEIRAALAAHRADLGAAHARTVEFVDFAVREAGL